MEKLCLVQKDTREFGENPKQLTSTVKATKYSRAANGSTISTG